MNFLINSFFFLCNLEFDYTSLVLLIVKALSFFIRFFLTYFLLLDLYYAN